MGKLKRREITKAKSVETHVEPVQQSSDSKINEKAMLIKAKKAKKTKQFQMRFTDQEFEKLEREAFEQGLNVSDIIRLALIEKGVL